MNITELMRMLPFEIVYLHIIPYTYTPQGEALLSDIKNFVETRETISEIYYNTYQVLLPYEKNADKNWLVNDILLFIKVNNNRDIYRSIHYIYENYVFVKKDIHSQFNIFWKSLSIPHRNLFIQIRKPKPKFLY